MRKALLLILLFSTYANGGLPTESVYYIDEKGTLGTTEKGEGGTPKEEQGLGPITTSTANGEQEFEVNLLRYNLHLGPKAVLPFYLFTSRPINSKVDADTIQSALLNPNGGVLNLKFSDDDLWEAKKASPASYVLGYDAGVKLYEVMKEDKVSNDYSPYFSFFFKADMPITEVAKEASKAAKELPGLTKIQNGQKLSASDSNLLKKYNKDVLKGLAGRAVVTLAAVAAQSDHKQYEDLFAAAQEDPVELEDVVGSLIARASIKINNQFSIEAGGVLASTSKSLDDYSYLKVSYDFLKPGSN